MAPKVSRDDRPEIQKTALAALQRLGGAADMTEIRFQTMFKYTRKTLSTALRTLRENDLVKYIPLTRSWQLV